MCEAWEEILMQMDSRLTKFVQVMNSPVEIEYILSVCFMRYMGSELDKVVQAIIPTLKKTRQKVCHEFKVDESYRAT